MYKATINLFFFLISLSIMGSEQNQHSALGYEPEASGTRFLKKSN